MKHSVWKSYRFPILLLSGIIIGSITGIIFKERSLIMKPLGDIFLNMLFIL